MGLLVSKGGCEVGAGAGKHVRSMVNKDGCEVGVGADKHAHSSCRNISSYDFFWRPRYKTCVLSV